MKVLPMNRFIIRKPADISKLLIEKVFPRRIFDLRGIATVSMRLVGASCLQKQDQLLPPRCVADPEPKCLAVKRLPVHVREIPANKWLLGLVFRM